MKIAVILGSTRPDYRLGERVAKWVMSETKNFTQAEFTLLDLREYNLPFYSEKESPRGNKDYNPPENVKKWLSDLSSADGYIFLTAEYNNAPPAAIKNALDFIAFETKRKPAAILGYTDGSNGATTAIFQLRPMLIPAGIIGIQSEQVILNADKVITEEGVAQDDSKESLERRFTDLVENLLWYVKPLKAARENTLA